MRGATTENLMAMADFFYHGETNVCQENLDSFLALAGELQLKGLRGDQTDTEAEVSPKPPKQAEISSHQTKQKSQPKSPKHRSVTEQFHINRDGFNENGQPAKTVVEKTLVLSDQATNNTDMESLDQQVKSMMTFSENANPYGQGRAKTCKVCGKEGTWIAIRNHIEAHHIAGIYIPCGLCGQVVTTRHALLMHKSRHHEDQ